MRNKVQLIGNIGAAPEVKNLQGGKKVVKLSLATNDSYKNAAGEKVKETQWHNLVAWNKTAERAEKYLQKGSKIVVDGKLINKSYTDKEGNKKYITEILVNDLLMLDTKKEAQ